MNQDCFYIFVSSKPMGAFFSKGGETSGTYIPSHYQI